MLSDDIRNELVDAALRVRRWAYAPYSGYSVGAAILSDSGRIYDGTNVENAAYPDSMCAERVAIFKAISEGERRFLAIAVASDNGGTPCGSCRQVLAEFGLDTLVYITNKEGEIVQESTVGSLLPTAFRPEDLQHRS
jgi:cytidine deaminase